MAERDPRLDLSGRVALVTGANRGIGRATALELARSGADVAVHYSGRTPESLVQAEEVAHLVTTEGSKAIIIPGDFADTTAAVRTGTRVVGDVVAGLGKIDIAVHNAGITDTGLFPRQTGDRWRDLIEVNLNSSFDVAHAALAQMSRKGFGRVVLVSSVLAHGGPGSASYAASKAGIEGLVRSTSTEYGSGKRDIRINAVAPGFIDTDMTKGAFTPEQEKALLDSIPLKRQGTPEEVAQTILFLVSPMASYIHGEVIAINGGMLRT